MKVRLKKLTSRSNGWGYAKRKQKLEEYIEGGRLLSPCQHEMFSHGNWRVAKAATYVYMEVVEEGENENCQLDKVWYG